MATSNAQTAAHMQFQLASKCIQNINHAWQKSLCTQTHSSTQTKSTGRTGTGSRHRTAAQTAQNRRTDSTGKEEKQTQQHTLGTNRSEKDRFSCEHVWAGVHD